MVDAEAAFSIMVEGSSCVEKGDGVRWSAESAADKGLFATNARWAIRHLY